MGRGLGRRHRTLQRQAVFVEEHHATYIVAGPDELRAAARFLFPRKVGGAVPPVDCLS
jgi:hypothetical protein